MDKIKGGGVEAGREVGMAGGVGGVNADNYNWTAIK